MISLPEGEIAGWNSLPGRRVSRVSRPVSSDLIQRSFWNSGTPPARIAWQLDRVAGGEERFLSALEFAVEGNPGPFTPALFRDAVRVAQTTEPARVLPRVPVGYRWGIVLSLSIGGLLWAYPPQLYEAPEADLDASPRRGPAPLEVLFQDGSIGAIDEFLWDFGDGQSGSGEKTAHVYERPGTYSARYKSHGKQSRERCSCPHCPVSGDFGRLCGHALPAKDAHLLPTKAVPGLAPRRAGRMQVGVCSKPKVMHGYLGSAYPTEVKPIP